MISKLRLILSTREYRRIFDNIVSLSSIQLVQYLLPLVTFPYLTRVLGPANFGRVAFAVAFIGYFQLLTDYGFSYSAPREIAIYRDDRERVSRIYSSVMVTKILLMFVSFVMMSMIVFCIAKFRVDYWLYFFTFGMVVGNLLFPVWFFQGVEKMKYISIFRILASLIYTALIFIVVKGSEDYLYVPLINSVGMIIVGLYSQNFVIRQFKVKFIKPTVDEIKQQLIDGWHFFISALSINFLTISNKFVLGLFVSSAMLGYYSVAEDIARTFGGLLSTVSQAMYPYFSRMQSKNRRRAKNELTKIIPMMAILSLFLSIFLIILAPFIVKILAGDKYIKSVLLLQIILLYLFPVGINTILVFQGIIAFGYKKEFTKIYIISSILHVILLFILIPSLLLKGAAVAVVITEFTILLLCYRSLRNYGILQT